MYQAGCRRTLFSWEGCGLNGGRARLGLPAAGRAALRGGGLEQSDVPFNLDLLAELAAALVATGPVPAEVVAAAKTAYELRYLDEELALLAAPDTAPGSVSAPSQPLPIWRIVVSSTAIRLELDLVSASLVGQLIPPTTGVLVVEWRGGSTRHAYINAAGRFVLDQIAVGDIRIRLATGAGEVLTTPWLLI